MVAGVDEVGAVSPKVSIADLNDFVGLGDVVRLASKPIRSPPRTMSRSSSAPAWLAQT